MYQFLSVIKKPAFLFVLLQINLCSLLILFASQSLIFANILRMFEVTVKFLPGCIRDLVFVVDESSSLGRYESRIKNFLLSVVSHLPVSETEVHVSLGFFTTHSRPAFDLDEYHSKNDVLGAISGQTLKGGHGDVNAGLNYVLDHALTPSAGDRKSASNIVVILTDDGVDNSLLLNSLEHRVHAEADVISVVIGHVAFSHLATDDMHQFRLRSPIELSSIVQEVANLIC